MITCAANGCPSTQTTKIDGNLISFFAFPEDDLRKNQWLHNCNLASGVVSDKEPLHLCELHFEKVNFTASRDLKSNALPTLFGRIEEPSKKRKVENVQLTTKVSPIKQKKSDENSHTLVTSPQSPFMQFADNIEGSANGSKANISIDHAIAINGSVSSTITHGNFETNEKIYRLTIQIDKIRGKPGPRCKKLVPLLMLDNDLKNLATNEQQIVEKSQSLQQTVKKICTKGNCKLKQTFYESKPAFQCEQCDKYYIMRKGETREDKSVSCSICSKSFSSPQSLYIHVKKHFVCDMCQIECNSQMTYDKHIRLHVSTDPLYPYKCHQCLKVFELKEDVKQHCLSEHPKKKLQNTPLQVPSPSIALKMPETNDYRCVSCHVTFRNEESYRNHVNCHKMKEDLRCGISETNNIFPVPNPLTGSQIGILQAVKFSCRVCSKEFDNVGEVDIHTRTHLEDVENNLKCNICKKYFKSNMVFSEHLKHHLSRAHPCPICSKAFINRTTLKIHLKTHGKA